MKPAVRSGRMMRLKLRVASRAVICAVVLISGRVTIAEEGWSWIDPDEQYDAEFSYYYSVDGSEVEWAFVGDSWAWLNHEAPIDDDAVFDPNFDYVYADGTEVEWEWIDADEEYDRNYVYVYGDGAPLVWEWVDGRWQWVTYEQEVQPDEELDLLYDYVVADGTVLEWEWVEEDEWYDPNYDYAYPDRTPVGEEYWVEVEGEE